ncbi:alpha/beta hydrolase family protein [Hamadaea tsunoensis]|uniref:alpha/beta hydrolase family protein n=1 Tax=Hamadaea tsunoensis TaxID=53368 RepID=UPI0003FFDD78|nr:alpha/beta hydrolase [Hamadaea tsunoensis]
MAVAALAAVVAGTIAVPAPAQAAYHSVQTYTTSVNGDAADVYAPQTSVAHDPWPVVLLLQGANVGRAQYAQFAAKVAGYGFAVVVPDHFQVLYGQPGLYATGDEAAWTVAWAGAENTRTGSPLFGQLDAGRLLLLGHSFGGAAGLSLATGLCTPPFCAVPTPAPVQLKGAAFYGANAGGAPVIANTVPVALVQGDADGIAAPAAGLAAYQSVQAPPKLYVLVGGANHYGITNTQNPAGARPDLSAQTLDQAVSVETVARWSAYWLRAQLGDVVGQAWVYGLGDALDTDVTTVFAAH